MSQPSAGGGPDLVLALDLGSSSLKAAVVDQAGRVLASAEQPIDTFILPGFGGEQDAEQWWSAALTTGRRAIRDAGASGERFAAVAVDAQWSVTVPVDDRARPLMNAVHWTDTRGGKYNRRAVGGWPRIQGYGLAKLRKWIQVTGMVPTQSGVDSLGHTLFIKHERPEVYRDAHKFLEPMDYLTARLTGRITATQKTMVPFLCMPTRPWGAADYDHSLLRLGGLDREKLPDLIPNNAVVGPLLPEVAEIWELDPDTPVVAGLSDTSASLIGSGAVEDFEAIIYVGTTLYATCHVPFKKTDLRHFMTSLPSPIQDRHFLLGEQCTGGKCVQYFLQRMVYADDEFGPADWPADAYQRFNRMAGQAPPGAGGVLFLPWMTGSVVPEDNPFVRGGFLNLSLDTDRSHLARAVFEALAYNNRWVKGPLEKFIRRPVSHYRFSGGGALSDLLTQIMADVLQTPIHQVADPLHTAVRGAALNAFYALGRLTASDIGRLVQINRVLEPDPANREVYDRMYQHYRTAFRRNKRVFAGINA
jgi:xylulokinase